MVQDERGMVQDERGMVQDDRGGGMFDLNER